MKSTCAILGVILLHNVSYRDHKLLYLVLLRVHAS